MSALQIWLLIQLTGIGAPPTFRPSPKPSLLPTIAPSKPTYAPTISPTPKPSKAPVFPTSQPTKQPLNRPTSQPSRQPTRYDSFPFLTHEITYPPYSLLLPYFYFTYCNVFIFFHVFIPMISHSSFFLCRDRFPDNQHDSLHDNLHDNLLGNLHANRHNNQRVNLPVVLPVDQQGNPPCNQHDNPIKSQRVNLHGFRLHNHHDNLFHIPPHNLRNNQHNNLLPNHQINQPLVHPGLFFLPFFLPSFIFITFKIATFISHLLYDITLQGAIFSTIKTTKGISHRTTIP